LRAAHAAAAAQTTAIAAPAADEVSAAIASFFGTTGQEFQALGAQAAAFHENFVSTLSAGAGQYLSAEAANVQQTLANAVNAPAQALSGGQSAVANAAANAAAFPSSVTQTINTFLGPVTFSVTGGGSILNNTTGPFWGSATGTLPGGLGGLAVSVNGNAVTPTELQITGGSLNLPGLASIIGATLGPGVTVQSAFANSITTFFTDVATGNGVGALTALATAPFNVAGAALGIGPTGTSTLVIPLSTNPAVNLDIPVGGIFAPPEPITVSWPTFSYSTGGTTYQIDGNTLAFAGTQGGGPFSYILDTFGL
jgi:hypothetical protein